MDLFKNLFSGNNQHNYVSRKCWEAITSCISQDLKKIRTLFFNNCIELIKENDMGQHIINNELRGKAEILTIAYQYYNITNYLTKYIHPSEGKEFADLLFYKICESLNDIQKELVYEFVIKFYQYQEEADKRILLFTQDLGNYIIGYDNTVKPSFYTKDSDYIINNIPEDKLKYIIIMGTIIVPLVPKLIDFTALVVANCFKDEELSKKINSNLRANY